MRSLYREIPQFLIQATWSSPVTNRFLLEAGGTLAANDWCVSPQPEVVPRYLTRSPSCRPTSPTARARLRTYGHNRSNNYNYRGSMSYITGSHNFKTGVLLQNTWSWTTTEPNNPVSYSLRNGRPVSLMQWATPISYDEKVKYNIGLYAQDRWTINRATLNLGVRGDFFNAFAEPQSLPAAGPFVPAREFPGVYDVPNWKDVSPRLGISYDVFGDGKTALKANLGRFPLAVGHHRTSRAPPIRWPRRSTASRRTWTDLNGNFAPDCDLVESASRTGSAGRCRT